MNGAALIIGIGGAMIVMAAALVDVMMVCVRCDASVGVIGNVLLSRRDMLKMDRPAAQCQPAGRSETGPE
jgi:hypothetical protein